MSETDKIVPLSSVKNGKSVKIKGFTRDGKGFRSQLAGMGLLAGKKIKIISSNGPMLVSLGESRIVVGRGMTDKILVEEEK